jgi:hypothetical protein
MEDVHVAEITTRLEEIQTRSSGKGRHDCGDRCQAAEKRTGVSWFLVGYLRGNDWRSLAGKVFEEIWSQKPGETCDTTCRVSVNDIGEI